MSNCLITTAFNKTNTLASISNRFTLLALALSAFCIGTTEFVMAGILPDIAKSFTISIPEAGWLMTGYATYTGGLAIHLNFGFISVNWVGCALVILGLIMQIILRNKVLHYDK